MLRSGDVFCILPNHRPGFNFQTNRAPTISIFVNHVCRCSTELTDLSPSSTLSLRKLAEESAEPKMIITSVGSDPSDELRTLARQVTGASCVEMAVQGEDQRELDRLSDLRGRPVWVVLKNVHLCPSSVLVTLERRLRRILLQVTYAR